MIKLLFWKYKELMINTAHNIISAKELPSFTKLIQPLIIPNSEQFGEELLLLMEQTVLFKLDSTVTYHQEPLDQHWEFSCTQIDSNHQLPLLHTEEYENDDNEIHDYYAFSWFFM